MVIQKYHEELAESNPTVTTITVAVYSVTLHVVWRYLGLPENKLVMLYVQYIQTDSATTCSVVTLVCWIVNEEFPEGRLEGKERNPLKALFMALEDIMLGSSTTLCPLG